MKFINKINRVPFSNIYCGEMFTPLENTDEYYLKIEPIIESGTGTEYNAVDLLDGSLSVFNECGYVNYIGDKCIILGDSYDNT